jgi:hypothetical protein
LIVTGVRAVTYGRLRVEIGGIVPHKVIIAVDVHAEAVGFAAGCGPPILAPVRVTGHAVVAPVRVDLRKDEDVQIVYDALDLGGSEIFCSLA